VEREKMQKLELTLIGKGEQINPEPRIPIEEHEHTLSVLPSTFQRFCSLLEKYFP